jgi:phage-related protein
MSPSVACLRLGTCAETSTRSAAGDRVAYRVLFATEGARGQVLQALEAFKKKTQKTPPAAIALAERRLRDWRARARR